MGSNKGSSHYKREDYSICNECDAHLYQADVLDHMTVAHCDSNFYKCHLCRNYVGLKRSSLFQHQTDKHDVSYHYLACPICMQFSSPQEKDVITHVQNAHSRIEKLYVCNYCSFKSKFDLDTHFKKIHSRYVCVFYNCKAVCKNSTHLFEHYMGHHFPRLTLLYRCPECDALFSKENSLHQHRRDKHGILEEEEDGEYLEEYEEDSDSDEDEDIQFDCQMCTYTSMEKKPYEQHFIAKHLDNLFNCSFDDCNYATKLFCSLTLHTIDTHLSHTFLRYDCFECEFAYPKIHSLIQHLRDKHSIVEYCTLCNTYVDDLSDHILSDPDHYHFVFSCRICDEEYFEKDELVDHLSDVHVYIAPLLRRLCYSD